MITNNKVCQLNRGAGLLMPISSLPSPYGIGTLGKQAYQFIDFLIKSGYKYWQVLPIGPTSYGDSPYQSFSAFAGNPYFIDLDILITEGLLKTEEVNVFDWGDNQSKIDYEAIYQNRFQVLKLAYKKSTHQDTKEYKIFLEDTKYWIDDYCMYMAIKFYFNQLSWQKWEEDIKFHELEALNRYKEELAEEIDFFRFCQFKFREQWMKLKTYANKNGILMIGDIPLYVALDSADVWMNRSFFEIDSNGLEMSIAGVPPDIFSQTGQRWGNPLYNWKEIEKHNFSWWKERMKANAVFYDIIRIDHFIGVVNYWSIPAKSPTAMDGEWLLGPSEKLTDAISDSIGNTKIIAEDLGILTKPVTQLIEKCGYPGMKIIEFGLDGPANNAYLPHNYTTNHVIAYIGTHDNETLMGYLNGRTKDHLNWIMKYYGVKSEKDLPDAIIRSLFSCIADVVIIQMQDLLKLDNNARMNFPSTVGDNWRWRFMEKQYHEIDIKYYKDLCEIYNR